MKHFKTVLAILGLLLLVVMVTASCAGTVAPPAYTSSPVPPAQIPATTSVTVPGQPTPAPNPTATASPTATPSQAPVPTISVKEVKRQLDSSHNVILVDVRPLADFDSGHINTAISIPLTELPSRYMEITKGLEVIVYAACGWPDDTTGTRAVQMLLEKGVQNVREMGGDLAAWQKEGYPVTPTVLTTPPPAPNLIH